MGCWYRDACVGDFSIPILRFLHISMDPSVSSICCRKNASVYSSCEGSLSAHHSLTKPLVSSKSRWILPRHALHPRPDQILGLFGDLKGSRGDRSSLRQNGNEKVFGWAFSAVLRHTDPWMEHIYSQKVSFSVGGGGGGGGGFGKRDWNRYAY